MKRKNNILITIFFILIFSGCKSYIEKNTPEYPSEIYEYISNEFDKGELCKLCLEIKELKYIVVMIEVRDSVIADIELLRSGLDSNYTKVFQKKFLNKEEDFDLITSHSFENIAGRIVLKRFCNECK